MMTKNLIVETQTEKHSKLIYISLALLILGLIFVLFLEGGRSFYTNKVKPNTYFVNQPIAGLDSNTLHEYMTDILNNYLYTNVTVLFKDSNYELNYRDLGVTYDLNKNFMQIPFYSTKPTHKQFLQDLLSRQNYHIYANLDVHTLESNLTQYIPELAPAQSAFFSWKELAIDIVPEQIGNKTNFNQVRLDILRNKNIITLENQISLPSVTSEDVEPIKNIFIETISKPVVIYYKNEKINISLVEHPEKLKFTNKSVISIEDEYVEEIVEKHLAMTFETAPQTLEIKLENDKVEFYGKDMAGKLIDRGEFKKALDKYLNEAIFDKNSSTKGVELALVEVPTTLKIDPKLQALGIKDLISFGYTTYHGSPHNRIHNINVGANRYNGTIIMPNELFSFNQLLGPVTREVGYLPELVIKSEGTVHEYGGGICQVSTTIYRAALFAGLDIVERYNHSYAVSYYSQVLGHGLDATIYPGVKDFKFKNDTQHPILMHLFTKGTSLTVKFYGAKDGRTVDLLGPQILSQTPAPASIYESSANLPVGTTKQIEKAVPGLSTRWLRQITFQNGEFKEEPITSNFRAMPAKYLISSQVQEG